MVDSPCVPTTGGELMKPFTSRVSPEVLHVNHTRGYSGPRVSGQL